MNWLDFEAKRSQRPSMVKLRHLVIVFFYLGYFRNAWKYFNKTYHRYSLSDPHNNDDISRSWVQRSRSQTIFSENVLSKRDIPIDGSLSKAL